MAITYTAFKGTPSGQVIKTTITKEGVGANEVLLENLYSGLCATDVHFSRNDMVLGHEGVGIVKQVGEGVKGLKVGDRVGVGYVRGGCGYCSACLTGYSFYCKTSPNSYGQHCLDTATWSSHAILPANRLARIPDSIPSEYAGPLMCAGQTVFIPFVRADIKPWDAVGIVGIGGLGHLAIQFAAKMGCRVVVFSGTASKKEEAMKLGASEFYTADDLRDGSAPKDFVNHLLVTTSQLPDWTLYLSILAPQSHIYPLTISPDDFKINSLALVTREITVHGSCASTMTQVNQMLDFAARHKIRPIIETFPMTEAGIAEAMDRLDKGKMRYRGVLKVQE